MKKLMLFLSLGMISGMYAAGDEDEVLDQKTLFLRFERILTIGDMSYFREFLIKEGVDCQDNDGRTFLRRALEKGRIAAVDILLEQNANVDLPDKRGKTPLHEAARWCRDNSMVTQLLARKANVNSTMFNGDTPLCQACFNLNGKAVLGVVRTLVEGNADVNKTDFSGYGPLCAAVQMGHLKVADYLVDQGAAVTDDLREQMVQLRLSVSDKKG